MNLELIKKYEKEFLHMLHGGTLLFHSSYHGGWHTLPGDYQWNDDYGFVINDKYIEFRKALVAGKKIQFFNTKERLYDSSKPLHTWQDIDTIKTHGLPSDYRIKPEEPKFKAGDWIRQGTRVFQYSYKDLQYDKANPTHCQNDELWKPKEGEICIFWKENSEYNRAIIGSLKQILSNGNYVMDYGSGCTVTYSKCMPFTGVLPPHMKEIEGLKQ